MEAYLATAVENGEEVIEEIILSDVEEESHGDGEWVARNFSPRRRRRVVKLKAPRKKREKKDWAAKLIRRLENTCSTNFISPKHKTRRGNKEA